MRCSPFALTFMVLLLGCFRSSRSQSAAAPSSALDAGKPAELGNPAGLDGSGAATSPAPEPVRAAVETGAVNDGTKGTIACGASRCTAGAQACVRAEDASARCVDARTDEAARSSASFACDDSSDCGDDLLCCGVPRGARTRASCIQPDMADGEDCVMQACVAGDGAPCPKGQSCQDGFCRAAIPPRATCDGPTGRARCPAVAPVCAWSQGKAACSTTEAPSHYDCTQKSDCGAGMFCCSVDDSDFFNGAADPRPRSACLRSCSNESLLHPLCASAADCPVVLVTGINGGVRPQECLPHESSADEPAWLRHCGNP